MRIRWSAVLVAAAVALGSAGGPATAQQTTHGCACFNNKTESTISFRYKWGDGEWQNVQMKPKFRNWICWTYADAQKSSPNLTFQLDVDMTKGSAWTTYAIARVQTADAHCNAVGKGGHYNVSYRPNTNNAFIQVTRAP
jgi:hypothetical protein